MYFLCSLNYLPQKSSKMENYQKVMEFLGNYISKWKPIRRIFHIIRSLICLHILKNKTIKNINFQESPCRCLNFWAYGKPAPGATFHYEFCCCFPQPAHTLHALESSIFNGILCRLLRSSDKDLCTTLG